MGAHRELAIAAMKIRTEQSVATDFMGKAGADLPMPQVTVSGGLPAMVRQEVPARSMQMLVDLVMNFGIGDYLGEDDYSTYYDPASPWYNVFYGAYALRSYKLDGSAWGYDKYGDPDFEEFLRIPAVDYNFFQAGQFGCPPSKMCFAPKWTPGTRKLTEYMGFATSASCDNHPNGWDHLEVETSVPSGLHDPRVSLGDPGTYVLYGVPKLSLLNGHPAYEPVPMRGRMFMRQIPQAMIPKKIPEPITLAFGVLCPTTTEGQDLMETISRALFGAYKEIGGKLE